MTAEGPGSKARHNSRPLASGWLFQLCNHKLSHTGGIVQSIPIATDDSDLWGFGLD